MSDARVADELEIRNLVARYSDAVLRLNSAAWLGTWVADGEWSILGESSRGHDALAARLATLTGGLEYVMQVAGSGVVQIDDSVARGRWSVTEHARMRNGDALFTMGAYSDDYCREGGAWLFSRRHFDLFYMGPPDMSGRLMPVPDDARTGGEA